MQDSDLTALLVRADELGEQAFCMPIDIFRLAREFADVPKPHATIAATESRLAGHENPFVRRVFFVMLNFMGEIGYDQAHMAAILLRGLNDENEWVQYDAAWAADVHRTDTPKTVARLRELAGRYRGDEDVVPSDASANLKKRAAVTLASLGYL